VRILWIAIGLLQVSILANGGGQDSGLDLSQLNVSEEEKAIIQTFLPQSIVAALETDSFPPDILPQHIWGTYYQQFPRDTNRNIYIIYCTDGPAGSMIRILSRRGGEWAVQWDTYAVPIGGMMGVRFIDLDCDSINEIIAEATSGGDNRGILIIKESNHTYQIVSPRVEGQGIFGRFIEYKDINGDCVKEVVAHQDAETKWDMRVKKVYKLDRALGVYTIDTTIISPVQR